MKNKENLQPEIQQSLYEFEVFLKSVGFKRIEGSIYGYLVLSPEPVTLEELHKALGISVGAASQGLNSLTQWGAVDSRYHPDKRAQVHQATQDSLKIVATIFQKREIIAVKSFRENAERAIQLFLELGDAPNSLRIVRLKSIVLTCQTAETVMTFVQNLTDTQDPDSYGRVLKALPKAFQLAIAGATTTQNVAKKIKEQLRSMRT